MNHLPNPSDIDLVIYHGNCPDGFGAAWSAWKLLGNNAEYVAAFHGDEPPNVAGKNVAILDFAYSPAMMKKIDSECRVLIVLDHHKTNYENLKNEDYAFFDMKKSGAMLSWEFFHSQKPAPLFIKYIQDKDLWEWSLPFSKEFSASFQSVPHSFVEYDKFMNQTFVDRAILKGTYILEHVESQVKSIAKNAVKRKLFEQYDCMIVNSHILKSEIGNFLSNECNGIGIVWSYNHNDKTINVSFRSNNDKRDVAKICTILKDLGFSHNGSGGGHKRAAGIVIKPGVEIEEIFGLFPS